METQKCKRIHEQGFTLMELMVVVFIIGTIITLASLSVDQNTDRQIEQEVKRLHQLVRLASEEAVLNASEISLIVSRKGYTFATLSGAKWEAISEDKMYRAREFLPGVTVSLSVYDQPVEFENDEKTVQIYLLSSGEITPFTLALETENKEQYRVVGSITGEVVYLAPGDELQQGG